MILSYQTIKALGKQGLLVTPMEPRTRIHGLSYGLGPGGYDIRVAEGFTMWPGRFKLASSVEQFRMPDNVTGMVCDKSTWIRRGLSVHNTVIEPGWSGYLTLELKMVGWGWARVHAGSPIAQIVFSFLDNYTEAPYRGKYQGQPAGPQKAILEHAAPTVQEAIDAAIARRRGLSGSAEPRHNMSITPGVSDEEWRLVCTRFAGHRGPCNGLPRIIRGLGLGDDKRQYCFTQTITDVE